MLKHLLLVDKDPESLATLKALFPSNEFRISVAHDGADGFYKACAEKPHCIIFEVDMIPTSGTIMYSRLRRHAETRLIPALVYSDIKPRYGTNIHTISKKHKPEQLVQAVRELVYTAQTA